MFRSWSKAVHICLYFSLQNYGGCAFDRCVKTKSVMKVSLAVFTAFKRKTTSLPVSVRGLKFESVQTFKSLKLVWKRCKKCPDRANFAPCGWQWPHFRHTINVKRLSFQRSSSHAFHVGLKFPLQHYGRTTAHVSYVWRLWTRRHCRGHTFSAVIGATRAQRLP